jgi:hypothetical protein
MEYLATIGGTSSLVLDMQKDWRSAKHRANTQLLQLFLKQLTHNTTIVQIIYGILMKQEFTLIYNMEQEFWLGKYLKQFILPFPNLGND